MDIWLTRQGDSAQIHPLSIHGMLWLQTHFEDQYWEALAESRVKLPNQDIQLLTNDAKEAGLSLSCLSEMNTTNLSSSEKLL